MKVRIDQTREHGLSGKLEHAGLWSSQLRDRGDAADQNEAAAADGKGLGRGVGVVDAVNRRTDDDQIGKRVPRIGPSG